MKKLLIVVLGVFSIMLQTLNAQDLSIVSNQDEDTTQVVLKGNGEQCNLWMYVVDGQLVSTDCKKMRNSKNVDIVCTKTKKICKSIEEVKSFVNGDDSAMSSGDSRIYEVTTTKLNIRDQPSATGKVLGTVNQGDRIKISEFSGKWGKSEYGWISGKHLKEIYNANKQTDKNSEVSQMDSTELTTIEDKNISWFQKIIDAILGFIFTFIGLFIFILIVGGPKSDGRFKTGYKDNEEPRTIGEIVMTTLYTMAFFIVIYLVWKLISFF